MVESGFFWMVGSESGLFLECWIRIRFLFLGGQIRESLAGSATLVYLHCDAACNAVVKEIIGKFAQVYWGRSKGLTNGGICPECPNFSFWYILNGSKIFSSIHLSIVDLKYVTTD